MPAHTRSNARRPRYSAPSGDWDDDVVGGIFENVRRIVGPRGDRYADDRRGDDGCAIRAEVIGLAMDVLGRALAPEQKKELEELAVGPREERASVIARWIVCERFRVSYHDACWMQLTRGRALDPAGRRRRQRIDITGQPVLRPDGTPMRHPDGQPATQQPRPAVMMIYR
jgi:hypothetical protein